MSFTPVGTASTNAENPADTASIAVTRAGVTAGNLIVVWAGHQGGTITIVISDSGGSSFTHGTINDSTPHGRFAFAITGASGSVTYTATFGANAASRVIHVWEFATTATPTLDTQGTSQGTASAASSGNITTTGIDELVMAAGMSAGGTLWSALAINGVAADDSATSTTFGNTWYRLVSATFTGAATGTISGGGAQYICTALALQIGGGGGGPVTPSVVSGAPSVRRSRVRVF